MTAQIKLKHSGGNGVIIEAPASNPASDKTITLPSDEAGVFATKDSANSLQNVTGINGGQLGNRNKIINGSMICSQRGSSFAAANMIYTLDRFKIQGSNDGAVTISQSTTSPDGFSKSFKVDVTTADTSIASGQYLQINNRVEAQDLQDLAYGTSAAKAITLSFYVRSNVTGTYTFAIQQADNSAKQVSQTYTINSANTWERKTFTFAGDTSGVINNDNGTGFQIYWNLAIGTQYTSGTSRPNWTTFSDSDFAAGHTANLLSSTSNEFYLTGIQLEVGSSATDFEHRSFGQELELCKRYYQQINGDYDDYTGFSAYSESATSMRAIVYLSPPMRAAFTHSKSGVFRFQGGTNDSNDAANAFDLHGVNTSFNGCTIRSTAYSGMGAADRPGNLQFRQNGSKLKFDAEL